MRDERHEADRVRLDEDAAPQVDRVPARDHQVASGVVARSYVPGLRGTTAVLRPVILYVPGGEWVLGGIETEDGTCRELATSANAVVVCVGYRPGPDSLDDCDRVLQWTRCEAQFMLGGDPTRVAVVGSGSGVGLAAGLAIRARDRGEAEIAALGLIPSPGQPLDAEALAALDASGLPPAHIVEDTAAAGPACSRLAELLRSELEALPPGAAGSDDALRHPAVAVHRQVEPETQAILDRLTRWDTTSIETIRAAYEGLPPSPAPTDPRVLREDTTIDGVRVRWYRPAGASETPGCLLYLHGGAYIMGTLEANDRRLDQVVTATGAAVVSVDYRLAPEHPYPAAVDDVINVWSRISSDPETFGVDPSRLLIAGSSAGAGLATAVCIRARSLGLPQPVVQLLVYPMLDDREIASSITALEGGPGHWGLWHLRAERLAWAAYLGDLQGGAVPADAAPGRARVGDLRGLPPAFLLVGDADALLDTNLQYASQLVRAGVPVELHVVPGVIHGGFVPDPTTPGQAAMLSLFEAALRRALETTPDAARALA